LKPPGTENPGEGVGVKLEEKTSGGYGYFLKPLIECSKCFIV